MTENLWESGCVKCVTNGQATVGAIDIDPHTEALTVDHVCNANVATFITEIKQRVERTTNYTFPLRELCIREFHLNMKNLSVPPFHVGGYFDSVRALYVHTSLVHFVFFKEKFGFKHTPMYTYNNQKLSFPFVRDIRDVFWEGWYKNNQVRVLEIEELSINKEIPALTLCEGMQSIHTLHLSRISVCSNSQILDSFRNTLILFAPFLERLVIFSPVELCMFEIDRALNLTRGSLCIQWPRLKECVLLDKWQYLIKCDHNLLELFPNLHLLRIGQDQTCLRHVALAPTLSIRDECFPNIHMHTARVRYRTHMAAHVFKYFSERLAKDLSRLLTRRYLLYFKYPTTAPVEFLYAPNTYTISKMDFDHLKNMYNKHVKEKKTQDGSLVFLNQADKAQTYLISARERLAKAKEAFDEKIIGKRKRLHNALVKCQNDVAYWEEKKEQAETDADRYKDMLQYSKLASAAYFKTYVREMLKLGNETRLVVADKWAE